tara:strand:- start:1025 stop:1438 length:414 start_codon:yes stop_codon:yes gene_type:complete
MKSAKAKGSRGERELIKLLHDNNWSAMRAAGSGSQKYPSPDILAGNAIRRLAIEVKVTKENKKYLQEEEIVQLQTFSHKFGAESWVGVKLAQSEWKFLMMEDLQKTDKAWVITSKMAELKGLTVQELLNLNNNNRKI